MPTTLPTSILRENERDILAEERRLAAELGETLQAFESSKEDATTLRQVAQALDEPFLLVVAGEFNAGKSAFVNALIGEQVLTEGVTPTTAQITLLRYGETPTQHLRVDGVEEILYPADFLRDIAIVDTPGTNAVLRHHEELTTEFVPRSDFILFVTSSDRPFTESERAFLERIRAWGKKVVLVLNKIDLLHTPEDLAEIVGFVREHGSVLLGSTPEIFPVSARLAQAARRASGGDEGVRLWEESRLGTLRSYLTRTLDDEGRARLKLLSPLGVMDRLTLTYRTEANKRQALLDEDARTIQNIEAQLADYQEQMQLAFEQRVRAVQTIVLEMRDRGNQFFDDTVRLGRIPDLMHSARIREEFTRIVIADGPEQIERAINDLIDWIVEQEHRLWQHINEYLMRRRQSSASILAHEGAGDEHVIGGIGATFDFNRRTVLQRVSTAANRTMQTYGREEEARRLAVSLQGAVAQTAVAGAGAVTLGVGLAVVVGTALADFTGIAMAIVLASVGFGILPYRRRRAKRQFDEKTRDLQERLTKVLRDQFSHELADGTERLNEALAPYTRFVRVEQDRVTRIAETLDRLQMECSELRTRIESGRRGSTPASAESRTPPSVQINA